LRRAPRTVGRKEGPVVGKQGEPQAPGERVAVAARQLDDLVAGVEDAPRAFHDLLARGGQLHAFWRALDELHAEVFLELLQLRGQRRLADEAALGGAAEM